MAAKSPQNQRDDALALGLARGLSVRGAAKSSGYSKRHAHRRLADSAFKQRVLALRTRLVEQATGLLTAGNCEAARTLRKLLKDGSSSIELAAAKALLDLGARMRETLELERRVSDLEQSLKEPDDES
jgi:phage terminase small subunit